MARVLICILGYGERPPNLQGLEALCRHDATATMLVTWHRPGADTATALLKLATISGKVCVETTDENRGSAGGYARLLDRAAAVPDWDYLLLLDDDLDISPGALDRLVAVAEADPAGHQTLFMAYRRGLAELKLLVERGLPLRDITPGACVGFHLRHATGLPGRSSSRLHAGKLLLDAAPYGGLLLPRGCLARLGSPEANLFLYADDAEWTLRFTRGGGLIRLVPEAEVVDRSPSWNATESGGGNLARRILHMSPAKAYYEVRNRNFLARKYYAGNPFIYALNRTVFLAAVHLLAAANGKFARARLIKRAIRDGEAMARLPLSAWPSPPAGLD